MVKSSALIMDQPVMTLDELSPDSNGWFLVGEGGQTNEAAPPSVCGGTAAMRLQPV